jgi:hypothetical protein
MHIFNATMFRCRHSNYQPPKCRQKMIENVLRLTPLWSPPPSGVCKYVMSTFLCPKLGCRHFDVR